jgi:hypothetical protein
LVPLAGGCTQHHRFPTLVSVCGAFCGEPDRAATDYSGFDCAIAARFRLLPADGGLPFADRCVTLSGAGTDPAAPRLSDLFDTGSGAAHAVNVGTTPRAPFWTEVSLYAPGSLPCQDHQPLLALGRSGVVDPAHADATIAVPLGCRDACETHGNVQAQLLAIEDLSTPADPIPSMSIGEIFPYGAFTATAGVCMAPPLTAQRGAYRSFAIQQSGANLDGTWVVDHSSIDGCVVIASDANGARQLSCLSDANTSRTTLQGYVLSAAHLDAVQTLNQSVHAQSGALVLRIIDPDDADPKGSALGARVTFGLTTTANEAEYPQDDSWVVVPPTPPGTTAAGSGVALFADALTGPYVVTFSDGNTVAVNAGGGDDPASVTVVVVNRTAQQASGTLGGSRRRLGRPR